MIFHTSLAELGWQTRFEHAFLSLETEADATNAPLRPARVAREEKGLYQLAFGPHEFAWAEVTGKFRHEVHFREDWPAVGDWVAARLPPRADRARIVAILPRASCLKRKRPGEGREAQIFAANVDFVLIAASLNLPLNERRLERYLSMAWDSGARPVIVLTKADLASDLVGHVATLERTHIGTAVQAVSARTGEGIAQLAPYLAQGQSAVLVGPSGVGKSTLLNRLIGDEVASTQDIREEDGKGRHTTTARSLHCLPQGGLLIDTPGIRELQLLDFEEGVDQTFADIEALASACRFTDCGHGVEPGCRVREALTDGTLPAERWVGYQKLKRELKFQQMKVDPALAREERERWKKVHREVSQRWKHRRG